MLLSFDFVTPGLNGKKGLMRSHFSMKRKWKDKIISTALGQVDGVFEERVKVVYRRGYRGIPMDRDGLHASAKFFLDSLVDIGVIKDDSEDYIEFVAEQFKTRKPITSIEITSL